MKIYVQKFFAWTDGENSPKLEFVPMLFRRRLSALTKMVIKTVHAVSDGLPPVPITFASEFGETTRQYKISDGILSSGEVSPANFSLSVFNTPASATSIVERNMTGYRAVFSGKRSFEYGLRESLMPIVSGRASERIFVFADERIPEEYSSIAVYPNPVCALALRISSNADGALCELDLSPLPETATAAEQALIFLRTRLPQ